MSRETGEKNSYPYAARGETSVVSADQDIWAYVARRRFLGRWIARLLATAGIAIVVVAVFVACVAYRAIERANLVAALQEAGCQVQYLHQISGRKDPLPEFLRERLGDNVWSEVANVSVYDWFPRRDHPTAEEVQLICEACRRFPRLRLLQIGSDHFSCDQMSDWPHLDRLEELAIWSAKLTDADLAIIGRMTRLKALRLSFAKVGGEGIGHLAKLPQLEQLGLHSLEFTGSTAPPVNGFPALMHLEMEDSPKIGDEAIVALGRLPALEKVIFNRTPAGDRSLASLIDGGKVGTLIMNESRVTDAGLKLLGKCAEPFSLHLAGAAVTNEGLSDLAGRQIDSLVLNKSAISDEGLRSIAEVKGLGYLSLAETKISGTGFSYLDGGEPLPRLRLSGAALTREGISVVAKARCAQLDLSRTIVGDSELLLFAGNADLSEIDLTETNVTVAGVRAFYQARTRLLGSSGSGETVRVCTGFGVFLSATQAIDPLTDLPIELEAKDPAAN